jgi:hypothetical protein
MADVTVDAYSGDFAVRVHRDDFNLPVRLAQPLLEAVYWLSSTTMRQYSVPDGEALFEMDGLIKDRFYGGDAQTLIHTLQNPH